MKTRDRILQTSLRLFNALGERSVTTNHIAAELGISPGNLYYHFRNKASIVFALFEAYSQRVQSFMSIPQDRTLEFADKVAYLEAIFASMWDYRFLHRELGYLLSEDAELRAAYRHFSSETVARGRDILSEMRTAGMLDGSDTDLDVLMLNIWVMLTSWTSFLQSIAIQSEQPEALSQTQLKRGIYQVIGMLQPWVPRLLWGELESLKTQYLNGQATDPLALFADVGKDHEHAGQGVV